jgi:hypothetical protein
MDKVHKPITTQKFKGVASMKAYYLLRSDTVLSYRRFGLTRCLQHQVSNSIYVLSETGECVSHPYRRLLVYVLLSIS